MLGKRYEGQDCGLARALEIIGERWTLLIVRDAFYGVRRFSDFAEHLDIPRAVLAERLRTLVDAGVLELLVDQEPGGRAVYVLTGIGRELWPMVHGLMWWGARIAEDAAPRRRFVHAACGAELAAGAVCASCRTVPDPADVLTAPVATASVRPRTDRVTVALREPHRLLQPISFAEAER